MPNHIFQTIIVTGINDGSPTCGGIKTAHSHAKLLFQEELVSDPTFVGHNFIQSFCIFPSGSGTGRDAQIAHQRAIELFCTILKELKLDFVAIRWDDQSDQPTITHSNT